MAGDENDVETVSFNVRRLEADAREIMVAAATRRGERLGKWLSDAIRAQALIQQFDGPVGPEAPGCFTENRASFTSVKHEPECVKQPLITLDELRDMALIADATARASGQPQPVRSARRVYALLSARLDEAAAGLPPVKLPQRGARGMFIKTIDAKASRRGRGA